MKRYVECALALLFQIVCQAGPGLAQEGELSFRERIELRMERSAHLRLQASVLASDLQLSEFTTDGCSGGMSKGWSFLAATFPEFREHHEANPPWESCCVTHDRAYHAGGSEGSAEAGFLARLQADKALQTCVSDWANERAQELGQTYAMTPDQVKTTYDAIARSMFLSVRAGGGPCSVFPWRWGYGWPECR